MTNINRINVVATGCHDCHKSGHNTKQSRKQNKNANLAKHGMHYMYLYGTVWKVLNSSHSIPSGTKAP